MYRVFVESNADKDLDTTEKESREKILDILRSLKIDPRPKGTKKLAGAADAWRIRVGNIRILYEIDDAQKEVRIYRIKKRDKVYKNI